MDPYPVLAGDPQHISRKLTKALEFSLHVPSLGLMDAFIIPPIQYAYGFVFYRCVISLASNMRLDTFTEIREGF